MSTFPNPPDYDDERAFRARIRAAAHTAGLPLPPLFTSGQSRWLDLNPNEAAHLKADARRFAVEPVRITALGDL